MRKYGLILIFILSSSNGVCLAQAECSVLDKNNPPLYISYERAQDVLPKGKQEPEKEVTLRLNNNTSCPIFFTLFDDPVNQELKSESVIPLDYLIFNSSNPGIRIRPPGAGGDVRWWGELKGGRSVLFIAPLKHFTTSSELRVSFTYSWDRFSSQKDSIGNRTANVRHDLLFYPWFLPKELIPKKMY